MGAGSPTHSDWGAQGGARAGDGDGAGGLPETQVVGSDDGGGGASDDGVEGGADPAGELAALWAEPELDLIRAELESTFAVINGREVERRDLEWLLEGRARELTCLKAIHKVLPGTDRR